MRFSDFPAHHAILLTHPDRATYGDELWSELSALSLANVYYNQTVLDIETARKIISWARSSYNGERVALISFHTVGLPAQNAMLKMLEEPQPGTRFILLTSNKDTLIDTVLSRVQHIHINGSTTVTQKTAEEFLATSSSFRMKLSHVVDILASLDEEGRKDREAVKGFILSLIPVMQAKKVESRYITETLEVASYASDPSVSGKALFEYLSLLLPVVK